MKYFSVSVPKQKGESNLFLSLGLVLFKNIKKIKP